MYWLKALKIFLQIKTVWLASRECRASRWCIGWTVLGPRPSPVETAFLITPGHHHPYELVSSDFLSAVQLSGRPRREGTLTAWQAVKQWQASSSYLFITYILTSTAGGWRLPLGAPGVRPAEQEWWATKISELLVRCRDDNVLATSPQHRQLNPVNMSAQTVDAGVQQRSAWCPIWELTSSTDQRLICLSRQETPSHSWQNAT